MKEERATGRATTRKMTDLLLRIFFCSFLFPKQKINKKHKIVMLRVSRLCKQQGSFAASLLGAGRLNDLALVNHFTTVAEQSLSNNNMAPSSSSVSNELASEATRHASRAVGRVYAPAAGTAFVSLDSKPRVHNNNGALQGSFLAISPAGGGSAPITCAVPVSTTTSTPSSGHAWFEVAVPASCLTALGGGGGGASSLRYAVTLSNPISGAKALSLTDEEHRAELAEKRAKLCDVLSTILSAVEVEVGRYAAGSSRYDQLLVYHHQVQSLIAQLRCLSFAAQTVSAASTALEETSDATLAYLATTAHTTNLLSQVERLVTPRASRADVRYDYLDSAFLLVQELRVLDGGRAALARTVADDLLTLKSLQRFVPGGLNAMLGTAKGDAPVRLPTQHLNLTFAAKVVEEDLRVFLEFVGKVQQLGSAAATTTTTSDKSSKSNSNSAAAAALPLALSSAYTLQCVEFLSEIYATVAVLCRGTASLTVDEEGKGQVESPLAQSFGYMSQVRRARILRHMQQDAAVRGKVWGKVSEKDYDEFAVHPVEASMTR